MKNLRYVFICKDQFVISCDEKLLPKRRLPRHESDGQHASRAAAAPPFPMGSVLASKRGAAPKPEINPPTRNRNRPGDPLTQTTISSKPNHRLNEKSKPKPRKLKRICMSSWIKTMVEFHISCVTPSVPTPSGTSY